VTASLWRRLTDLPPRYGEALGCPEARTTEETKRPPGELADALVHVARRLDERALVVLLSESQAALLRAEGEAGETPSAARLLRVIEQRASGPSRQRRLDLWHRAALVEGAEGEPSAVLLIRDGKIAPDVAQRSRSRSSFRYTLDDEVAEWVREQAAKRAVSQSDVVQDVLRAAMKSTEPHATGRAGRR
jgi:hypothetical protein